MMGSPINEKWLTAGRTANEREDSELDLAKVGTNQGESRLTDKRGSRSY